jgi:O-methyltransferase
MHNTFILEILKPEQRYSKKRRAYSKISEIFGNRVANLKRGVSFFDFFNNDMLNLERGINIYHLLNQVLVLNVPGDVVEAGCYEGLTSIIMQKTLDQSNSKKRLHVYDSFEGLPEKQKKDGKTILFRKGFLKTKKDILLDNFRKFDARPPEIHVGWFKDTLPTQLPKKICFAHLDGDFYSSIKESLESIYPRLSKNAIVVIDDYCDPKVNNIWNELPGVKRACDEFFKNKKEKVSVLLAGKSSHGYFRKQ